jgi:hypothetical protein
VTKIEELQKEIARLRTGLEFIADPLFHLKQDAERNGHKLDGAISSIITIEFLQNKAKTLLNEGVKS